MSSIKLILKLGKKETIVGFPNSAAFCVSGWRTTIGVSLILCFGILLFSLLATEDAGAASFSEATDTTPVSILD